MTNFVLSVNYLLSYFRMFSSQDLDGLYSIFDDNLVLRDWDISCIGKSESLVAVKNIYASVDSIFVEPAKIIVDATDNSAACILNIFINSDEKPLKVVDFIRANSLGLIVEISAYKQ